MGSPQNSLPVEVRYIDQATSAWITDLKQRGMLEDTLVIWGGEFGRTPISEGGDGHDHNPFGYTMWMAGGGIKGGMAYGATDEFGFKAVENRVSVHDLHATILQQPGIEHEKITYGYRGLDFRLTDLHGKVVPLCHLADAVRLIVDFTQRHVLTCIVGLTEAMASTSRSYPIAFCIGGASNGCQTDALWKLTAEGTLVVEAVFLGDRADGGIRALQWLAGTIDPKLQQILNGRRLKQGAESALKLAGR